MVRIPAVLFRHVQVEEVQRVAITNGVASGKIEQKMLHIAAASGSHLEGSNAYNCHE